MYVYVYLHIYVCAFVSYRTLLSWMKKVTASDLKNQAISFLFKILNLYCLRNQEAKFRSRKGNEITKATVLSLTGDSLA